MGLESITLLSEDLETVTGTALHVRTRVLSLLDIVPSKSLKGRNFSRDILPPLTAVVRNVKGPQGQGASHHHPSCPR